MTNWVYLDDTISIQPVANLPDGYSLYVADSVFLATQSGAQIATVFSTYNNAQVRVEGTIAGPIAIQLGNDPAVNVGEVVRISEGGKIFAAMTGVSLLASSSTIENDGSIISEGTGITLGGSASGTLSEVDNAGKIDGGLYGIKIEAGSESITVNNTGSIKGVISSYETAGTAGDDIINSGTMKGQIILGAGADFYDGRKGTIAGAVLGGENNDQIQGGAENNEFYGQAGKDLLQGGKGADFLSGGTEADTFVFTVIADSTAKTAGRDQIYDFARLDGDKIDLHAIDADIKTKGNQDFDLIGKHAFSHDAGELRFEKSGSHTILSADVNGDGKADFAIEFDTLQSFKDADFSL